MHMCKPRSLYAVHVADYKVWSGYFGQFVYMCVVVHSAQHRSISTTGAFIVSQCLEHTPIATPDIVCLTGCNYRQLNGSMTNWLLGFNTLPYTTISNTHVHVHMYTYPPVTCSCSKQAHFYFSIPLKLRSLVFRSDLVGTRRAISILFGIHCKWS